MSRTLNPYQVSYYEILNDLLSDPDKEVKSRVGEVNSRFSEKIKIDLKKEFPLMEIKDTSFKNIVVELLWFIKGDTNIKFLVDNKCNIWNDDAFRWYKQKYVPLGAPELIKDVWLGKVKSKDKFTYNVSLDKIGIYTYGDLDIVYGRQWRSFGGKVDQLKDVINTLRKDSDDRRLIILGHNPVDIQDGNVSLPACHNYMQFYTQPIPLNKRVEIAREKNLISEELNKLIDENIYYNFDQDRHSVSTEILVYIGLQLDQLNVEKRYLSTELTIRSNDFILGNPYNIASYAILTTMIAQCVGMIPNILACEMVDCHIYKEHIDAAMEWISRFDNKLEEEKDKVTTAPNNMFLCKSKLTITPDINEIDEFKLNDFSISNYNPLGKIFAPLLT